MCVLYFLSLHLLFFCVVHSSDGVFAEHNARCHFRNVDEIEYTEEIYFNKEVLLWYNGSTGIWKGDTSSKNILASYFNNDPNDHFSRRAIKDVLCLVNAKALYETLKNNTVKPNVRLKSVEHSSNRHSAMLVCSAYDFYPKTIMITWLRNGQKVNSDVTSIEEMSNGDWSYQIHSYLEYTPTAGEIITCMVEHYSLPEPQLHDWGKMSPMQYQLLRPKAYALMDIGEDLIARNMVNTPSLKARWNYYCITYTFQGLSDLPKCIESRFYVYILGSKCCETLAPSQMEPSKPALCDLRRIYRCKKGCQSWLGCL
ncbi:H-2 class II histocompatibility antigen, E-S beta chain-like isoform X1 [Esox lucius]|uniref:H-2 class II histocompatibility antigen, E-S beta chain-like isoform X1 n=1 Tax=Esox lucius TaxID=8010 RepID=UPI001476B953|nr:H-2 class II histocompatibility antigen, E-S beta chain-like isoform X1 [Esox lucius]